MKRNRRQEQESYQQQERHQRQLQAVRSSPLWKLHLKSLETRKEELLLQLESLGNSADDTMALRIEIRLIRHLMSDDYIRQMYTHVKETIHD